MARSLAILIPEDQVKMLMNLKLHRIHGMEIHGRQFAIVTQETIDELADGGLVRNMTEAELRDTKQECPSTPPKSSK